MNQPIQTLAKIGVVLGTSFPASPGSGSAVEEALAVIAKDSYFTAVELSPLPDPTIYPRIRGLCEQSQLAVAFAAGPTIFGKGLSLNTRDPEHRKAAIAAMMRCVDEAISLGAERFTLVSGPETSVEWREQEVNLLVDSILQLCEYSLHRSGPPIDIETFDRDVERRRLLGPTSLAVEVVRRVRARFPTFGLLIDMSHVPLLGEGVIEAIDAAGEILTHVHLGNCFVRDRQHPEYGDSHPRFGAPGSENGIAQLRSTLQKLLDLGFLGHTDKPILSFEVRPRPYESPEAVLAGNKRALEAAWWSL